jgi:cytidine deaminase
MAYESLIASALNAGTKAITLSGDRVGVALEMKDGTVITGFNIESHAFPTLHAEVVAVITALKNGYIGTDFKTMVIVCSFPGIFPACASCRQFLWDHTNPDLTVVAFNVKDNTGGVYLLKELYPMPYPAEPIKTVEVPITDKVETDEQKDEDKEPIAGDVEAKVSEGVQEGQNE